MSEASILAAFWNRSQRRFVELLEHEVRRRSGVPVGPDDLGNLCLEGLLRSKRLTKRLTKAVDQPTIYHLSRLGQAQVQRMVDGGTLPLPATRLTATPQEAVK